LDRSSAVSAEFEARPTSGPTAGSFAQTPGTVAGDRSALHECSRHIGSAPVDTAAGSVVWLRRLFLLRGNRSSDLPIPTAGVAQIAVPAISLSRISPACWCARARVGVVFTVAGTWCTAWQAGSAGSCRETRPALCRARRAKADHRGKRARGLADCDRARDDP